MIAWAIGICFLAVSFGAALVLGRWVREGELLSEAARASFGERLIYEFSRASEAANETEESPLGHSV